MNNRLLFALATLFLFSKAAYAGECPEIDVASLVDFQKNLDEKKESTFRVGGKLWLYEPGEMMARINLDVEDDRVVYKTNDSPDIACNYDVEDSTTGAVKGDFRLLPQ